MPAHAGPRLRLARIVAIAAMATACSAPQPPQPQPASKASGSRLADDIVQAERARAIEASGREGFWVAPAAICRRDARAGQTALLGWNVKASGAMQVVVYVVDKNGREVKFRQGDAIGEARTGPWLRPGITFLLRNADGNALLGNVALADKPCG